MISEIFYRKRLTFIMTYWLGQTTVRCNEYTTYILYIIYWIRFNIMIDGNIWSRNKIIEWNHHNITTSSTVTVSEPHVKNDFDYLIFYLLYFLYIINRPCEVDMGTWPVAVDIQMDFCSDHKSPPPKKI